MKRYTIARGFSLIELLIVIAIVVILAKIAIPSYRAYVFQSQRRIAISSLLQAQSTFENFYSVYSQYPTAASTPTASSLLPANTTHYNYTVTATTSSYIVTATAIGSQASDTDSGTSCTTLSIDNTSSMQPLTCWHH